MQAKRFTWWSASLVQVVREAVTSRTGAAVEGALSVEAGNNRVGGTGLVWKFTFVDVSHAGRVSSRRLPAALTDALEFRLRKKDKHKTLTHVKYDFRLFCFFSMQKIKEAPVRWPPGRHRCRCRGNTGPALQSCSRRSAQCTDSQTTRAGSHTWRQQAARYHRNAESINFKSAIKAVSAHLNEPGELTQVAPFWQPWTPPDSTWHSFTSVSQRGPFGSDKAAGNVKETDSVVHCQTRRPLISDLKSFKVCFFNLYYVWIKKR